MLIRTASENEEATGTLILATSNCFATRSAGFARQLSVRL